MRGHPSLKVIFLVEKGSGLTRGVPLYIHMYVIDSFGLLNLCCGAGYLNERVYMISLKLNQVSHLNIKKKAVVLST